MTFLERRLPADVSPQVASSPQFMTTIKRLRGGAEYRNANWQHPLRRYQCQYNARTRTRVEDELLVFIMETRGSLYGFRVRDWSDYQATDEILGAGDGSKTHMPFVKSYGSYQRRISKPDPGTVSIKVNGTTLNPNLYFIDMENGNVVFVYPIASGDVVTWSGQFDVPCRFEDDAFDVVMHTETIASVASVGLMEERVRDNTNPAEYVEIRELLATYDRTDLLAMYDVLHTHVHVKWRDTA